MSNETRKFKNLFGLKAGDHLLATALAVVIEGMDVDPVKITANRPPPLPPPSLPAESPK